MGWEDVRGGRLFLAAAIWLKRLATRGWLRLRSSRGLPAVAAGGTSALVVAVVLIWVFWLPGLELLHGVAVDAEPVRCCVAAAAGIGF